MTFTVLSVIATEICAVTDRIVSRWRLQSSCSCRSGQVSASEGACPHHVRISALRGSSGALSCRPISERKDSTDDRQHDMRLLRSQMIAFDRRLKEIEDHLKPRDPSEQQLESKSGPSFAAAAIAMARTVLILFAVGAAT